MGTAAAGLAHRVKTLPSAAPDQGLVDRDVAKLLYGHGTGTLIITAVAATALTFLRGPYPRASLATWLGVMLLIVLVRAIDLHDARKRQQNESWKGGTEKRRFLCGAFAAAAGWAALPLLFFKSFTEGEMTSLAVIVCAMASGSVAVLAAEQWAVVTFIAALLLPLSLMFALTPGPQHALLGMLGLIMFLILSSTSRVTHRATMTAIRVNRRNEVLMVAMDLERRSSERANLELLTAQHRLRDTLETLEERIAARTADLARVASRDSLTGLYNRSTLTDRLTAEISRCADEAFCIAVLFLDLDGFKEVNELKGHMGGDRALREVGDRLRALIPVDGTCARWGGDEFVVILTNLRADLARDEVREFAVSLRTRVADPMTLAGETVHVDAVIGIALFPEHGGSANDLIRAADMAMYAAKQSGRDRVRVFDPALALALHERNMLEGALREALSKNELRLVFQPIVDGRTSRCEALEALLRWEHPTRGTIPPSDFIPFAERSGEIIPIGRWVLEQACIAAASWPGDPAPAVSVNVSVTQLIAGCVVDDVQAALTASGLPTNRFHLEVTETVFAADHKVIIPTLFALRALGIRISLDDFGTGFSSLSYLRSLPIDTIKIDKSFVDDVHHESGPIIKAIRTLADALHIEVVAEGVESAECAATLLAIGVSLFQGYLFSRPIPQPFVAGWLLDAAGSGLPSGSATGPTPTDDGTQVYARNRPSDRSL